MYRETQHRHRDLQPTRGPPSDGSRRQEALCRHFRFRTLRHSALTIEALPRWRGGRICVSLALASMPKFFIKTYGCQMNERDSEQVARSLLDRGYEAAANEAEADVVLLNTCSVRDMAEQKALGKMGMLGRMAKRRPEVVFGFLGCMAQARGAELLKLMPHRRSRRRHAKISSRRGLCRRAARTEARTAGWIAEHGRSALLDRRHGGRSWLAGNDPRTHVAGAAGDRLCFHHAGLQHALHFLHRAADARRGAQPDDRGDR